MVVTDIAHAKHVLKRLRFKWDKYGKRHLAVDTETEPVKGYSRDDTLVYGRAQVLVFSVCHMGESYSFPTSHFHHSFPLCEELAQEFLIPLFLDGTVVKVAHNWTYDANVFYKSMGCPAPVNFWDTLIGCWKASEWLQKGLKARAPFYGRILRETSTVKFTELKELALYAEEDVIQTDEIYQMHRYGKVFRKARIHTVGPKGEWVAYDNPLCAHATETLVVENESLDAHGVQWMRLLELPVLRAVVRAQRRGFPFDVVALREVRGKLSKDMRQQLRYLYQTAGETFNVGSGPQLSAVCAKLRIHNPHTTKKGAPSWNAKALSKIKDQHPFLSTLVQYKATEKLRAVYVGSKDFEGAHDAKEVDSGLEPYVDIEDGSIHTTINTVGAITGRSSSSNPNLQQIPSRKDIYGIKSCFVATPRSLNVLVRRFPDRLLIVLDYAQLEIRVMCLMCQDGTMTRVLVDRNGDIHTTTATEFQINRDPDAKQLNFLLLYGGMEYMLSEQLTFSGVPTTPQQAAAYIVRHKEVYPRVAEYRQELLDFHKANNHVVLFCGRRRHLDEIDWDNKHSVHKAETTLSNNVIQGCIAPETKLLTEHGLMPIVELMQTTKVSGVGKRIWSGSQWETVSRVFSVGKKPLWKVCLSDGTTFRTSDTHLWKNELGQWVKTADLTEGDFIQQSVVSCPLNFSVGVSLAEAEFIGMMIGDGSYGRSEMRLVRKKDKGIAAREDAVMRAAFGEGSFSIQCANTRPIYNLLSKANARARKLGLSLGHKAACKEVPVWLLTSSQEHRKAFIRGYYLTDGGTSSRSVNFTSISRSLLEGVQTTMYSLGIRSTLKEFARRKANEHDYYRLILAPESKAVLYEILKEVACAKVSRLQKVSRESLTNKGNLVPPRLAQRVATEWQQTFTYIKSPSKEYYRRQAMFTKLRTGKGSLDFTRKLPLSPETLDLVSKTYLKVVSVTNCRKQVEMFDLTVEPSHQYAAWNGAIMHNSGQDFLKAAIVRSDYQCINPDEAALARLAMPKSHRLYLKDKAVQLEKHRRVLRRGDVRWRLQVHDENIFSVRPEEAEECMGILADIMSWRHYFPSVVPYSVPLVAEGGVGFSWKAAKSKDKYLHHVKAGYDEWEKYQN